MSLRKYQEKSMSPHPHLGALVRKVMINKAVSQAELARRMQISSSSLAQYFQNSSCNLGFYGIWA